MTTRDPADPWGLPSEPGEVEEWLEEPEPASSPLEREPEETPEEQPQEAVETAELDSQTEELPEYPAPADEEGEEPVSWEAETPAPEQIEQPEVEGPEEVSWEPAEEPASVSREAETLAPEQIEQPEVEGPEEVSWEPAEEPAPQQTEQPEVEEPALVSWEAEEQTEQTEQVEGTAEPETGWKAPSGPLSQALAAAQNVIGALRHPSGESEAEEAERLPDEPPPWMEEDASTAETQAETLQPEPSQEPEQPMTIELEEEDLAGGALFEPSPPEEEPELVIELDEEAEPEALERLAAEVAGQVEMVEEEPEPTRIEVEAEPEVQEVEAAQIDEAPPIEEAPEDLEPAGGVPVAEEQVTEETPAAGEVLAEEEEAVVEAAAEEEPADTTPSAYTELASISREPDRPAELSEPTTEAPRVEWGALWRESAQGWIEDEEGHATWRPIVTTTATLSDWEVDTYLGVVAGEVVVGFHSGKDLAAGLRNLVGGRSGAYEKELARGRAAAVRNMVDEGVARGAHAVVGVKVDYESLTSGLLVTAAGTAVTLKTRA